MGSSHSAPRRDRSGNRRRSTRNLIERNASSRSIGGGDLRDASYNSSGVVGELPSLQDMDREGRRSGTRSSYQSQRRRQPRRKYKHTRHSQSTGSFARDTLERDSFARDSLEIDRDSFVSEDSTIADRLAQIKIRDSVQSPRKTNIDDDLSESFSNDYADDLSGTQLTPSPTKKTHRKAASVGMTGEVASHVLLGSPISGSRTDQPSRLGADDSKLPDTPTSITMPTVIPPLEAAPVATRIPPTLNASVYDAEPENPAMHTVVPLHYPTAPYILSHENIGMSPEFSTVALQMPDFFPQGSRYNEWMGRSLETLVLGYGAVAPILCLPEDEDDRGDDVSVWGSTRRRSTVSTLGSDFGHRSSLGSRRGSLVGSGNMHGGTLANYYNRRRTNESTSSRRSSNQSRVSRRGSASHGPTYRRRMSMSRTGDTSGQDEPTSNATNGGPNIALSLIARETTGRLTSRNAQPAATHLRSLGGNSLFGALDRPAGGMCSEVAFLSEVIDSGDWAETHTVITRISPRLIGDPALAHGQNNSSPTIEDPNLSPTASPYLAGGGRLGLERDAFVHAGGVEVLIRVFREPSFVGAEMARTYDARDLSEELVTNRLAPCWNETLASLRELVYSIPSLVDKEVIFDDGEFVPFLFTLLSHDSCFDSAASLIEEILSLQSHSPPQPPPDNDTPEEATEDYVANVRQSPPTTFFLGNVPDLYKLWSGFNCRQLAHFCRILALLVFEPEDRQLLESPAVLKSIELLQLRRNRAARAGRDSTVDMNQAILLGDDELIRRLLKLLRVMNFAPILRRGSAYHVLAQWPFIADTLVMLGLSELDGWEEIDRLDSLARKITTESGEYVALSELGAVAEMLEGLSSSLERHSANNHLGNIIHVISTAQQAGVVVGIAGSGRSRQRSSNAAQGEQAGSGSNGDSSLEGLASAAGILSDQVLAQRLYPNADREGALNEASNNESAVAAGYDGNPSVALAGNNRRPRVNTPEDAANALQFNALLLGPYQVEVLFVLCTLLGGRRKIDAQEMLNEGGVIPILDDMFQRLPWDSLSPTRQPVSNRNSENGSENRDQPNGIHGPGCECTPESALCVQYLRLLHNFCDRDCDNYAGRRLLLSPEERSFMFDRRDGDEHEIARLRPGLLSKIIVAFTGESDESPYRFWLASCVESYLRGSSQSEQVFVAQSGLLKHLINDITSERLHCAGSLQTSFDLLGELCKGNGEVLRLLVKDLDEESFRKLMSVAAANLVDSNVFIRSLLLSLERISSSNSLMPLHLDPDRFTGRPGAWRGINGIYSRSYLSHSWWDSCLIRETQEENANQRTSSRNEQDSDSSRQSDWFPTLGTINAHNMKPPETNNGRSVGLHDGVGHFGWVFTPDGDSLSDAAHAPNTVERLSWFLAANQTRLLRDLLGVVDLRNINHENICCLNTAVVIAIFAYRRQDLPSLLQDLQRMNNEERETKRRALDAVQNDNVIDRAFVQAMKYTDIDPETPGAAYSRRASLSRRGSMTNGPAGEIGDRNDVMRNFREVLWFWVEYYTHRGRDRLSLEFSSHLRFQEWIEVVSLLGADNGAPTSLVPSPVMLPRSPYQRAPRIAENPLRVV